MILTILFGLIGFGIMVFFHELGHFVVAKRAGIEVDTFSLGWGKKLFGFDHRGTNYRISLVPFGGYCKFRGEIPTDDESKPAAGTFYAAPPWKRIIVSAAGPLANILFAVVVLTIIWWAGFNIHSDGNYIVLASDYSLDSISSSSPATRAGLSTGDRIVAIDGQPVEKFQDILELVATAPNQSLNFVIDREDRQLSLTITPELDLQTGAGRIGVYAWRDPVVAEVAGDSAGAIAGLMAGDRITAANGEQVAHTISLYQILSTRPENVELVLLRDGNELIRKLVLSYDENGVPDLGLSFRVSVFRTDKMNILAALARGAMETGRTLGLTVKGIGLLFQGVNFRQSVAGPLRITYYVGSVAASGFKRGFSEGIVSFFRFLCSLSIILFLMNLLPIPALDGGQIVLFLVEIARRKPVKPRLVAGIQTIGFSFLIVLALVITFSDVLFFLGR
ncbi:MAG TPA: PDZ domain-containing protein [bacterium]|nr:PDZ domain-containing protein [bacterium]